MRTRRRVTLLGPALLGMACSDVTAPRADLALRLRQQSLTLRVAQDSGISAMLVNRSPNTVILEGGTCVGTGATLERQLPWSGWQSDPPRAEICLAIYGPLSLSPGDSAVIGSLTVPSGPGVYRLRLPVFSGRPFAVYSPSVTVR